MILTAHRLRPIVATLLAVLLAGVVALFSAASIGRGESQRTQTATVSDPADASGQHRATLGAPTADDHHKLAVESPAILSTSFSALPTLLLFALLVWLTSRRETISAAVFGRAPPLR
ncbi:MAG TPA: hypothetical protein PLQ19_11650 [Aeromicrobium sp.]|nr:hypothetical protein [Aeromicrobium sp.]